MDLIGSVLFAILIIAAIIIFGAYFALKRTAHNFRKGMEQAEKDARAAAGEAETPEDMPEDSDARRYYFNRSKKVDKERAEDIKYEEVDD